MSLKSVSISLSAILFFGVSAAAQQPAQRDLQGIPLLQQALTAMTGTAVVSDLTLSRTVNPSAGSDDESGTDVLLGTAIGQSRIKLSLPSGQRTETRDLSLTPPAGAWMGTDGVSNSIAAHNLWRDPTWLFPVYTLLGIHPAWGRQQNHPTTQASGSSPATGKLNYLYVIVTDKKGKPVTDLTSADFIVKANGAQQQVLDVAPSNSLPLLIGLLVDATGSRHDDSDWKSEMRVLSAFLNSTLINSDRAYIVAFSYQLFIVTDITSDRAALELGLEKLAKAPRRGSTAVYDSIFSCARATVPRPPERKVMIVLSDFDDNASQHSVAEAMAQAQRAGTAIFTLVESSESRSTVHRALRITGGLSEQTGGASFFVESPKRLAAALSEITAHLRNSYQIRFQFLGSATGNKPLALDVDVLREGTKVYAPRAFFVAQR